MTAAFVTEVRVKSPVSNQAAPRLLCPRDFRIRVRFEFFVAEVTNENVPHPVYSDCVIPRPVRELIRLSRRKNLIAAINCKSPNVVVRHVYVKHTGLLFKVCQSSYLNTKKSC